MSTVAMVSPDYMLRHIARGDGRPAGTSPIPAESPGASPLTRYYTANGYPPGRWIGSGLDGLSDGTTGNPAPTVDQEVTETQMRALFEDRTNPVTGEPLLARKPQRFPNRAERIDRRVRRLWEQHPQMPADARAEAIERIRDEERRNRGRHAVRGFDLTFKPPKSVSVLWGIADHGVQVQLYGAHREALAATLAVIERHMLFTRVGAQGVRQVPTRGLIGAAFDHWDSRRGDPLLHTHVTVPNAVQGNDGVWRTIDSRALLKATVAASETYNVFIADAATRRLGTGWEERTRAGTRRNAGRELGVVPMDLVDEFSQRSILIEAEVDAAVTRYQAAHDGRLPSQKQLHRMRQAITLDTRTGKQLASLADATAAWRDRAEQVLGEDAVTWARRVTDQRKPGEPGSRQVMLTAADIAPADTRALAARTLDVVASKRSTWSRWNLHAEAMRQIASADWQFTTPGDAWQVADRVVAEAVTMSIDISAPQIAHTPDAFLTVDGRSQMAGTQLYTSEHVLAAEDRLIGHARNTDGPAVDLDRAMRIADQPLPGRAYSLDAEDQAPAAVAIATSGRVLDILVGPAGTGKTTTMAGLRAIWEAEHGPGSVVGLAPSAKAAQVLAADLGVDTDNTAQWLAQQQVQPQRADRINVLRGALATATSPGAQQRLAAALDTAEREHRRWALRPGQLLVVDEAGMAGTFALDALAEQAAGAGAKILLVGDPHQLSPVEVGGAFGMLTADRPDTPTLSVIRRFTDPDGQRRRWEEEASIGLRLGDKTVIDTYLDRGRVNGGTRDTMVDAAYTAWQADTADQQTSILIAGDNATVRELNERARNDLIADGTVTAHGVTLHDGLIAGTGDRIVTRQIDRTLADGTSFAPAGRSGRRQDGFVRNGQQWHVQTAHDDGALTVRLLDNTGRPGAASITLPAAYVAAHVELAYATTAHRAQGMTVDTSHTLADRTTARELFYVTMTRGRAGNHCYLSVEDPAHDHSDHSDHSHGPADAEPLGTRDVLDSILGNTSTAVSARQTIAAEQDRAGSLAQLAAEYETLAGYGHDLAAAELVTAAGIPGSDTILSNPDFHRIAVATRAAARWNLPTQLLAQHLAEQFPGPDLPTVDDIAESIDAIVTTTTAGRRRPAPTLIAGVVPDATAGITNIQVLRGMTERASLMRTSLEQLVATATTTMPGWLTALPARPHDPAGQQRWQAAVTATAAYRNRWSVPTDHPAPLGDALTTANTGIDQRIDHRRAQQAIAAINTTDPASTTPEQSIPTPHRPHL